MRSEARVVTSGICVILMMVAAIASPADGPRFTRREVTVEVPDVTLIDQYGREVRFRDEMLGDRPVFVDFIFATCTTICPVLSAGYISIQRKLGAERKKVLLVSITIDPEHDGPEELRKYLDRYGAKSGWDFFTGTREDIDKVMRAFDAFVPDKMSHRPQTLIHAPGRDHWIEIYGFASSKDLMKELELALGDEDAEGERHDQD
jgi:protein SCO1/2